MCTRVCTRQGTVREKDEIIRQKDKIIQRVVREKDKIIKRLKVSSKTQIRLVMRAMLSYLLLLQCHGATCQGRGVGRSAQLQQCGHTRDQVGTSNIELRHCHPMLFASTPTTRNPASKDAMQTSDSADSAASEESRTAPSVSATDETGCRSTRKRRAGVAPRYPKTIPSSNSLPLLHVPK